MRYMKRKQRQSIQTGTVKDSRFVLDSILSTMGALKTRVTKTALIVVLFAFFFLKPPPSSAGGMFFYSAMSGTGEIRASRQRAVLWERDRIWELHIQPLFQRGRGAGVWVVPFPVMPDVSESDHDFLDQMEMLTAPLFVSYCTIPPCGSSEEINGSEHNGAVFNSASSMDLWERDTVGDLDFSLLSSINGDDIVEWLKSRGYVVPEAGEAVLDFYKSEGAFFFIGRVGNTADPDKPLKPVRFSLPGLYPPYYPLHISLPGVSTDAHLNLTLWVVFDRQSGFVPSSHAFATLQDRPLSVEEHGLATTTFFDVSPDRLLVSLTTSYGTEERYDYIDQFDFFHRSFGRLAIADLGYELPAEWNPSILEIRDNESWVFRYEARFDTSGMAKDLRFTSTSPGQLPVHDNLYIENIGYCHRCKENMMLKGCSIAYIRSSASSCLRPYHLLFCIALPFVGFMIVKRRRKKNKIQTECKPPEGLEQGSHSSVENISARRAFQ